MRIPTSLVDAARSGYLVPLVGSGLSIPSGVRSWSDIITVLKARMADDSGEAVDLDMLETPDAFATSAGPSEDLFRILREAVEFGYEPNPLHQIFADLPFRTCLTTNWDLLLEQSIRSSGRRVNVITDDDTARSWREAEAAQLVKFHGSIDNRRSIVVGLSDYSRRYQQPSLLMSLVRIVVATRPILFLGFGLKDVFVKAVIESLHVKGDREHFVVVPEGQVDAFRLRYLNGIGCTIVTAPRSDDDPYGLHGFLSELRSASRMEAVTRLDRTAILTRETVRLRHYVGANRVIRVRASMGPLATPADNSLDVYGDDRLYDAEDELRRIVTSLVTQHGWRLKLICNPIDDGAHAALKGYSTAAYRGRLAALAENVAALSDGVEVAVSARASDVNDWIAADKTLIESRKMSALDGRLFDHARVDIDRDSVSGAIRRFDEQFDALCAPVGGARSSTVSLLEQARAALQTG